VHDRAVIRFDVFYWCVTVRQTYTRSSIGERGKIMSTSEQTGLCTHAPVGNFSNDDDDDGDVTGDEVDLASRESGVKSCQTM